MSIYSKVHAHYCLFVTGLPEGFAWTSRSTKQPSASVIQCFLGNPDDYMNDTAQIQLITITSTGRSYSAIAVDSGASSFLLSDSIHNVIVVMLPKFGNNATVSTAYIGDVPCSSEVSFPFFVYLKFTHTHTQEIIRNNDNIIVAGERAGD